MSCAENSNNTLEEDDFLEQIFPGQREAMMEMSAADQTVGEDLLNLRASRALTEDTAALQQLLNDKPLIEEHARRGDQQAAIQLQEIQTRIEELQEGIQVHQLALLLMKDGV